MSERINGTVKWFNNAKGFGFIESENGTDIFVHRNGLAKPYNGLKEKQAVTFELKQGDKGQFADDVKTQ